jgi:hypothetical protein
LREEVIETTLRHPSKSQWEIEIAMQIHPGNLPLTLTLARDPARKGVKFVGVDKQKANNKWSQ